MTGSQHSDSHRPHCFLIDRIIACKGVIACLSPNPFFLPFVYSPIPDDDSNVRAILTSSTPLNEGNVKVQRRNVPDTWRNSRIARRDSRPSIDTALVKGFNSYRLELMDDCVAS